MKDWILTHALGILVPVLIAPLAYVVVQNLKAFITALDRAPAWVKQGVVLLIVTLLSAVAQMAGVVLPDTCASGDRSTCLTALTDTNAMKILLTGILTMLVHAGKKQEEASAPFKR